MRGLPLLALSLLLGLATFGSNPAVALDPINNSLFSDIAIHGYDPVAYFNQGKPVEGSDAFTFKWKGAVWRFASAADRDAFSASPEKYAPQFGGYCSWAVSQGYTADIDPAAWKIVNGKLYLNYDKEIQKKWEANQAANIAAAEANWPGLLQK